MSNIAQKAAQTAEVGGSVTALGSGLAGFITQNHELIWALGVLTGVVVAILGFFVNLHYKKREDERAQERHVVEMKRLNEGIL